MIGTNDEGVVTILICDKLNRKSQAEELWFQLINAVRIDSEWEEEPGVEDASIKKHREFAKRLSAHTEILEWAKVS